MCSSNIKTSSVFLRNKRGDFELVEQEKTFLTLSLKYLRIRGILQTTTAITELLSH